MGYVEYNSFFCSTTDMVKDSALDTLPKSNTAPTHSLENPAETIMPQTTPEEVATTQESNINWEALSPHAWATALSHVEVYLD